MSRFYIVFFVSTLIANMATCQQLVSIPDETYWNTPYSYKYHPKGYERPYKGEKEDLFNDFAQEIEHCYHGKCRWGTKIQVIDTDIAKLLPQLLELVEKTSSINLDYCDSKDTVYRKLLTYLYNASIAPGKDLASKYLEKAKDICQKIPNGNMDRTLAFIQINSVQNQLDGYEKISNKNFALWVDSESHIVSGIYNYSMQDFANWYECLGDCVATLGFIDGCYLNYQKALWYARQIDDGSERTIRQQRIRDKINAILVSTYGNLQKSLNIKIMENIDSMDHETDNFEEFKQHSKLIELNFKATLGKEQLDDFNYHTVKTLYNVDLTPYLPLDIISAILYQQNFQYSNHHYDLCRQSLIITINQIISRHITRTLSYTSVLQNLIWNYTGLKQYDKARWINEYIRKISEREANPPIEKYLPNKALIYLCEDKRDSAKALIHEIIDSLPLYSDYTWHSSVQMGCYNLLKTISIYEDNHTMARVYDSTLQSLEMNTAEVLSYITQMQTGFEHDRFDDNLYGQINYETLWGLSRDSAAIAATLLAQSRDSLLNLEKLNAALINLRFNDSLSIAKIRAEAEAKETRKNYMLLLAIGTLFIALVFFIMKIINGNIRQQSIIYEKESFKAAFFGHAIKESLMDVESRIEIGLLDNDSCEFESAKKITHGLSVLFREVTFDKPNGSNLSREVAEIGRTYIETMSLVFDNPIGFIINMEKELAEKITIPQRLLIHLYVNAVEHGKLSERPNSEIKTSLLVSEGNKSYILSVLDNGMGTNNNVFVADKKRKGGLFVIERGLKYYNKQQRNFIFKFDKQNDVIPIINSDGQYIGTRVNIKILKYV